MRYKILYLTFHPEIGGGETILLSLLSKLDRKIFEPKVVITAKGQLAEKLKKLNIETHILPLPGYLVRTFFIPGASPQGIWEFLKLAKKIKPDLIHLNHLNLAVYCGIAGKILKIPVVATSHGLWDCFYFYQDLVNNFFVDKILSNTPKVAQALLKRKIVNPKKVEVVYFGVDTKKFKSGDKNQARKVLNLPQEDLIITIVGRLDPEKDHLTFLAAAQVILEKIPKVTFLIVGSKLGDFSKESKNLTKARILQFLSQHPNLAKKVIFRGFANNMPQIYQASDILVSSSLQESFGLVLAEAAACQIPVVSTNVGSQDLIIQNGKTGFLVPPKRPSLLAQKILELVKNPKLRYRLGVAGRKHIMKNFSIETYAANIQAEHLRLIKSLS